MVRFGKKVAVLTLAGALAAMSVTGCGSIKEDATVATVGDEKITLGVAISNCKTAAGAVMRLIMPE